MYQLSSKNLYPDAELGNVQSNVENFRCQSGNSRGYAIFRGSLEGSQDREVANDAEISSEGSLVCTSFGGKVAQFRLVVRFSLLRICLRSPGWRQPSKYALCPFVHEVSPV